VNDRIWELEVFLRVAEERSFSAASRSLNCTPSAISKLILRLENRLGLRLFHRTSRVLKLTQEGDKFLEAAQRVLDALHDAENVVGQSKLTLDGVLRINTTLTFAENLIAPVLPDLLQVHPQLRIEVIVTASAVDMFENQIDVSIQSGRIPDSSLIARRLMDTRWVVCASPEYLHRAGTPRTPDELHAHTCLNFLPGTYRGIWQMRVGDTSIPLDPQNAPFKANSAELLRMFALKGMGIVRLVDVHVRADLRDGRLVRLLEDFEPDDSDPVYAIYPSRRNLSPRVQMFLEFLSERLERH
jgi:DNA-binding transcriptional LysR family regulator